MNWFKRIFCGQEEFNVHANGLPPVSISIPMPKVKPPKADKNISEPVLSFVKCVQENPKRFVVTFDFEYYGYSFVENHMIKDDKPKTYHYSLLDTKTKESWSLFDGSFTACYSKVIDRKHTHNPEWLTEDEKEYLIVSIKALFHNRKDRKTKLEQIRKERRIRNERNRLKEIYK